MNQKMLKSPLFGLIGIAAFLFLFIVSSGTINLVAADVNGAYATEEKILVSIAQDAPTWLDDRLFTINPDGSDLTAYFDFSQQTNLTTGRILGLYQGGNSDYVYFHSTHAFIYTPAGRNVFRYAHGSSALDQITPGPNSGDFSQTGNSTVSGRVEDGSSIAYNGSPVYLEGVGTVNTGGDGSFSFSNVPAGSRWLVAYNNTLDLWEARAITVVSNLDVTNLILVPSTGTRMNFEFPVPYNDRIYYLDNNGVDLNWTDADFSPPKTVYSSVSGICSGFPKVDAYDVSQSGKIVLYDYQEGCGIGNLDHVGLYTLDSDGGNKQILRDMLNDVTNPDWDDPVLPMELFWSPDETKIAAKISYGSLDNVLVFDATNGAILGNAFANTTSTVITLHSWSPDGNWLLFSEYDGDAAQASLGKIVVNGDGSLGAVTTLLTNQPISSATWGNIDTTTTQPNPTQTPTPTPGSTPNPPTDFVYLPMTRR
ncbi:MAG: hypothetical protein AAGD96_01305 [Chloroflexota bacterium]